MMDPIKFGWSYFVLSQRHAQDFLQVMNAAINARAQNGNHELQKGVSTVPHVRARFDQSSTAGDCSCGFIRIIKVGGFIPPSNKHGKLISGVHK